MPEETIRAFQDHGEVRGDTVLEDVDKAHELLEKLAKVGVDYDDVTETLELEGVQKFADSFDGAARRRAREARTARRRVAWTARELIDRIWERDPTVWTGARRGEVARLARRAARGCASASPS